MNRLSFVLIAVAIALQWAFMAPPQLLPTNLKITVRNELGNVEEGVSVQLFATKADYEKEENAVTEGLLTDKKGVVKFKDLKTISYYILATKDDKNNYGAGVQTDKLEAGKVNKVTVIIE